MHSPQPAPLEWNGDAYHRLSDMQYSIAMDNLRAVSLRGDETLIDAGCGSGRITAQICKRLPEGHVLGVDVSSSMLKTARRTVRATAGQEVEFVQADLQRFRYARGADVIFSNMALHFVADHARMYKNFADSLRPGGKLVLQFGSSEQKQRVGMQLMDLMNAPPFADYLRAEAFHFYGANVASTMRNLQAAGFIHCDVRSQSMPHTPAQGAKMVEFFRTTVAPDCHARLPTAALRSQFDTHLQKMLDGAFTEPFTFLRVRAQLPAEH